MKKTVFAVALALIMALSLFGCAAQPAETTAAESSAAPAGDTSAATGTDYSSVSIAQSMPTLNNPWYVLFANGSKDMAEALGVELSQVTNPETNAWAPEE